MNGFADIVPLATAPATNVGYDPLIGGPSGTTNPTPLVLATGYFPVMTVDVAEKYVYTIDGSGNLLRGLLGQTPTQILPASAFGSGATVQYLDMRDNATLWAATSNHTVLTISTTAPYTVTTLAGVNGTSGSADGTGAAATFGSLVGIAVDPVTLGFAVVWDNTIGGIRKVTTAGVVTTINSGDGVVRPSAGILLDTAGNAWFAFSQVPVYRNLVTGVQTGVPGYTGSEVFPMALDNYLPASAYFYSFAGGVSGGTVLLRQPTGGGTVLTVATAAHQVNNNDGNAAPMAMCMRTGGLYFVDRSQNLTRIAG